MPTAQDRVAAPRRTGSKLTAPKLASARKHTGRAAVAERPAPKGPGEGVASPAAAVQPAPSKGKTQVWIPGAPLPGVTSSPAGAPTPSRGPAPSAVERDDATASPVTGNTLRGAFGGAVAAAFAETFGETPPNARGGEDANAPGPGDQAAAQAGDAPDMNTVVEVGPPAALRDQAAQGQGATQPGPQPAPVRGGKTQIWGGGGLPPTAGARPVASAGAASTAGSAAAHGPAAASFQTDVAFPDADRDTAGARADAHAASSPEAASPPMKTTGGFPPTGPNLLAAAEAARAAADAARAGKEPAPAAPTSAPTPSAQPTPTPAQPAPAASPAQAPAPAARPQPPPDFRRAAEHGFTRKGRDAAKGGGVPVWLWVAGGVVVLAIALALALSQ